jgi:hypothetical protein
MDMSVTHAHDALGEFFAYAIEELDGIINRFAGRYELRLDRESAKHWTISDSVRELVMFRSPDRTACVRFAKAFRDKHPETLLDASCGLWLDDQHSVRVPDLDLAPVIPIRKGA